jgi:hypothetical protein
LISCCPLHQFDLVLSENISQFDLRIKISEGTPDGPTRIEFRPKRLEPEHEFIQVVNALRSCFVKRDEPKMLGYWSLLARGFRRQFDVPNLSPEGDRLANE